MPKVICPPLCLQNVFALYKINLTLFLFLILKITSLQTLLRSFHSHLSQLYNNTSAFSLDSAEQFIHQVNLSILPLKYRKKKKHSIPELHYKKSQQLYILLSLIRDQALKDIYHYFIENSQTSLHPIIYPPSVSCAKVILSPQKLLKA